MRGELVFSFQGDVAETHSLPAHSGIESVQGLVQVSLATLYFLEAGQIRRRNFSKLPVDFRFVGTRPGSLEFVLEYTFGEEGSQLVKWVGTVAAAGVIGNYAHALFKSVFGSPVGEEQPDLLSEIRARDGFPSGNLETLIQSVEPALRRGHQSINHGSESIVININGDNNVVTLNKDTKDYIWENVINNAPRVKLFSIGGYDSNSRLGKAFDLEEGRNISFELMPDADQESVETILESHRRYALRQFRRLNDASVALVYTSVDARNGRPKKIRVLRARPDIAQLGQQA